MVSKSGTTKKHMTEREQKRVIRMKKWNLIIRIVLTLYILLFIQSKNSAKKRIPVSYRGQEFNNETEPCSINLPPKNDNPAASAL